MDIDKELIQACIRDDREQQERLYEYCFARMFAIGVRYMKNRNDARSAFHQAFIKILNGLEQYEEQQNFDAWVKRIMVNTCIDEIRKRTRHHQREYPFDPGDHTYKSSGVDWNQAESNLNSGDLIQLIQSLPEKTRQVFNMYVMESFQHSEISELLEMSEGTSKWHLSKARKMLQEKIAIYFETDNLSKNVS